MPRIMYISLSQIPYFQNNPWIPFKKVREGGFKGVLVELGKIRHSEWFFLKVTWQNATKMSFLNGFVDFFRAKNIWNFKIFDF